MNKAGSGLPAIEKKKERKKGEERSKDREGKKREVEMAKRGVGDRANWYRSLELLISPPLSRYPSSVAEAAQLKFCATKKDMAVIASKRITLLVAVITPAE